MDRKERYVHTLGPEASVIRRDAVQVQQVGHDRGLNVCAARRRRFHDPAVVVVTSMRIIQRLR
jgi:hypothetical protein